MASVPQWVAYGVAAFIVMVSFLNPGGLVFAVILASVIVFVALAGPFVKQYALNASHGRWSDRQRQQDQEGGR